LTPCSQKPLHTGDEEFYGQSLADHDFVEKWHCNISSRLRITCQEWPVTYEFSETRQGDEIVWINGHPMAGHPRSNKRQDLFAWLALTTEEEESMDKWDLFPHLRDQNSSWWQTYKRKKHALQANPLAGPQLDAWASRMLNDSSRNRRSRVATQNFSDGAIGHSAAFPALAERDSQDEVDTGEIVYRQVDSGKAG
jgi:hypothetical protein